MKEEKRLGSTEKRNKRLDLTDRVNGASTSEIMDRNYSGPNSLAFDGVSHSSGIVFPLMNRAIPTCFENISKDIFGG